MALDTAFLSPSKSFRTRQVGVTDIASWLTGVSPVNLSATESTDSNNNNNEVETK
ncbi:hypothetical protein PI124_g10880 [Phytophthora idaei]|nr:hypothetical protein PI126_g6883 [Phytophthora idaei]KAG3244339.1 hypothetical protein PI124_g10880 [Phytophthora idaei]